MPKSDQKVDLQRYQVIPRTLIFLFDGDHVLLLKGSSKKKIWSQRYNGLGGHVEAGEDILSAAKRELWEEAGLQCDLHLCGTVMCDLQTSPGILLFVFRGEIHLPQLTHSVEGTLEWISLAEILSLPVVEDLPTLLNCVYPWRLSHPVFSATNRYDEQGQLITTFF